MARAPDGFLILHQAMTDVPALVFCLLLAMPLMSH